MKKYYTKKFKLPKGRLRDFTKKVFLKTFFVILNSFSVVYCVFLKNYFKILFK